MNKTVFHLTLFLISTTLCADKDIYKYISLGPNYTSGAQSPTEQISLGVRVPTPLVTGVDAFDISMSFCNHTNDPMHNKQLILPKIVILKNLPKSIFYTDKFYLGMGCSIQENSCRIACKKNGITTKKGYYFKGAVTSFISGVTINKTPYSITYIQCELNIPIMLLSNEKYQHSTNIALSFNIGI